MNEEMKFCQSCGMPLQSASEYGTETDGTPNTAYCTYCYQQGRFTMDCTMEEMIEHCAQFHTAFKHADGRSFTRDEAIEGMRAYFPQLKRWQ